MKVKVLKQGLLVLAVAMTCGTFYSCKKTFDIEPETSLTAGQVYRNVFDADAAVVGVYGKLMGLAKQYEVLNELRGDLMEVTENSDRFLREISTHNVSADNPYANPRPFYALINDCNDVLKNFDIMLQQNKFKQAEYNQRYSDIGALRSWLYLQLGIHFGKVPYVTDPLENIDAVKDPSKYPVLEFDQLLDSLITFTEALPFKDPYPAGTSLIITTDQSNTSKFFIEKNAFLGDLHLWRGHYTQAATYYRYVMEGKGYNLSNGSDAFFNNFKVRYSSVTDNNDLSVGYTRFREMDERTLVDNNSQGWRSMFARGQDAIWNWEWLWVLPFNSNFSPVNPFVDMFSNRGGSYLVKPSQSAIDNWNSQTQSNGFPYDARGKFSYRILDGKPVIVKYLYNYLNETTFLPTSALEKKGQWFLNRAAAVHLHFAEAANRDNHPKVAFALVDNGFPGTYPVPSGVTDVTPYQNSLNEPAPYDFDARMGDYPRYRAPWHRHSGIRGRARLQNDTLPANISLADSVDQMEIKILNEGALELAYEGYRWPDLLRIALRRTDGATLLANKIYDKLKKDNVGDADDVKKRLLDKKNWYLPLKW